VAAEGTVSLDDVFGGKALGRLSLRQDQLPHKSEGA
jgi:hypothetical protein